MYTDFRNGEMYIIIFNNKHIIFNTEKCFVFFIFYSDMHLECIIYKS